MSFWYLATPYSKFPGGISAAFTAAAEQAALLIRAKVPVFSPIAHTHPIATLGGLDPYDHDIWLPADQALMSASHGMVICMLEGWETSFGIQKEIEFFSEAGKPIVHMTPGVVPGSLMSIA